jgi:hypothetical protein
MGQIFYWFKANPNKRNKAIQMEHFMLFDILNDKLIC